MIENEIKLLLNRNPFFGELLLQLNIKYSKIETPTLGVGITKEGIQLFINNDFWITLEQEEKIAVLEHELLHIVNNHLTRIKDYDFHRFNIAADLAINQQIEHLPNGALLVKDLKYPKNKTSEQYYDILKNDKDLNKKIGGGFFKKGIDPNKIGDHRMWKKAKLSEEIQKEMIKDIIRNAYNKSKIYGTIPGDLEREIKQLLNAEINWKNILNSLVATSLSVNKISTIKRKNRRYEFSRGFRKEEKVKLLIGIDTSGSINEPMLNVFTSEIKKINMYNAEIHIAVCDWILQDFYKLEKNKNLKPLKGGGGTSFRPVFEKANKLKPDMIVYFTDGYGDYPEKSKYKTLWALTNEYEVPFGRKMLLKI